MHDLVCFICKARNPHQSLLADLKPNGVGGRSNLKPIQRFGASTLPETNSKSPLKMDGWNTTVYTFLLGHGLFSGAFAVSFREGNISLSCRGVACRMCSSNP